MGVACRVDELYQAFEPGSGFGTNLLSEQSYPVRRDVRIKTGLRFAPTIVTDGSALNSEILNSIEKLRTFESLKPNWDSHNGRAIETKAYRPALNLILLGIHLCALPEILPDPHGGVALRWSEGTSILEFDVVSETGISVFFSTAEAEIEPEEPVDSAMASDFLRKFRSAND